MGIGVVALEIDGHCCVNHAGFVCGKGLGRWAEEGATGELGKELRALGHTDHAQTRPGRPIVFQPKQVWAEKGKKKKIE